MVSGCTHLWSGDSNKVLEINAHVLANISVKGTGQVQIIDHLPVWQFGSLLPVWQ